MINDNENKTENEKVDHKDTKYVELGLDMDTNILNINCVCVMMVKSIKQHLSDIWTFKELDSWNS